MGVFNFFSKDKKAKLDQGLEKTKSSFFSKISTKSPRHEAKANRSLSSQKGPLSYLG